MSEPRILVTGVGRAQGSRAAAAALACAGAEPDRAGLLVELTDGRPPRPALLASAAARGLEERLAAHLPEARAASRGQLCHLALSADSDGLERLSAAMTVARGMVGVVHIPPRLLQAVLATTRVDPSATLLRADLAGDRALTALAARDLIGHGLRVGVLKRPLSWVASRRALAGALAPGTGGGLPPRLRARLLDESVKASHACYIDSYDPEADPTRVAQPEWGDHAGAGSR